ncbi:MAG: L,D-transpeptidase family protein [Zoogloeaceae bacterium]|jgi:murein L,D-transpeptidase YafK|nr:L,D-transpeptidase family protein [Zoogloeaceae bacterium]
MQKRFWKWGALGVSIVLLGSAFWYFFSRAGMDATPPAAPKTGVLSPHVPALLPALLPPSADSGPEPQLERIFAAIEGYHLDRAMQLTEGLILRYPNFRLAYLIKGDLFLARAQPLSAFGAAQNAPADRVADLREEAFVRLQGYKNRPAADAVPRYLLQLRDDQRYAIIVDTRKARLYLYQNDQGRPRLVSDYYVTQGKLGAEKTAEGDKRTPVGVYHITSHLPREKLADMYGHGAYPLNYPNEWDRAQGRGGSGIWLHGTPSDTFSRPPKASDGCVVLANPDFDRLGDTVQIGLTPVIITNGIEWLAPDVWQQERDELKARIDLWRADWESMDVERYLAHYSPAFQGKGQTYAQFAGQKRQVNRGKSWINLRLEQLSVFRNPGAEEVAVVSFEQLYDSNNLSNRMQKRQYWRKEQGRWKIVYEGAA